MNTREKNNANKNDLKETAHEMGSSIKYIWHDLEAHTFIGYDQKSLPRLPSGHGMKFLAF